MRTSLQISPAAHFCSVQSVCINRKKRGSTYLRINISSSFPAGRLADVAYCSPTKAVAEFLVFFLGRIEVTFS